MELSVKNTGAELGTNNVTFPALDACFKPLAVSMVPPRAMGGSWARGCRATPHGKRARQAACAIFAALTAGAAAGQGRPPAPVADHHMHVISPESARVLKISCARMGPIKCPPEISTGSSTGADAVAALDHAGISRGVLLSTGYFFGSPEVADLKLDVARETRAENQFVVDQARTHCGRLVAFISVDPLAPNALSEIAYWGRTGGASGLKLHMANSNFNFRSPAEVRKLAAVFAAAARWRSPIVIHLNTRAKDYGARDARIFLAQVVPAARGVPIQIAHAAGGGGVSAGTLSALGAFADAIRQHPAATANLDFDLAMTPDEVSNSGRKAASAKDVAALKALMRRIGLKRFVLASDWTSGMDLAHYYDDEREALALTPAEWAGLAGNEAPYLAHPTACPGGSVAHGSGR